MIIGLSGYAQSGKDTVAEYLIKNYGYRRLAFADKLRESLYYLNPKIDIADMIGVPLKAAVDGLGWENVKIDSQDARELLQRMGTEVGRNLFGENFWVNQIMNGLDPDENVVITDVRFPNEYESIKYKNGIVWRVVRHDVTAINNHISETALDKVSVDGIIVNDSTKEDLYETLDYLMQHL